MVGTKSSPSLQLVFLFGLETPLQLDQLLCLTFYLFPLLWWRGRGGLWVRKPRALSLHRCGFWCGGFCIFRAWTLKVGGALTLQGPVIWRYKAPTAISSIGESHNNKKGIEAAEALERKKGKPHWTPPSTNAGRSKQLTKLTETLSWWKRKGCSIQWQSWNIWFQRCFTSQGSIPVAVPKTYTFNYN